MKNLARLREHLVAYVVHNWASGYSIKDELIAMVEAAVRLEFEAHTSSGVDDVMCEVCERSWKRGEVDPHDNECPVCEMGLRLDALDRKLGKQT